MQPGDGGKGEEDGLGTYCNSGGAQFGIPLFLIKLLKLCIGARLLTANTLSKQSTLQSKRGRTPTASLHKTLSNLFLFSIFFFFFFTFLLFYFTFFSFFFFFFLFIRRRKIVMITMANRSRASSLKKKPAHWNQMSAKAKTNGHKE